MKLEISDFNEYEINFMLVPETPFEVRFLQLANNQWFSKLDRAHFEVVRNESVSSEYGLALEMSLFSDFDEGGKLLGSTP